MTQTIEEFFNDFRQELLVGAEANGRFQLDEFMESIASELIETGVIEGFDLCHFRALRGMRVDGYWFDDEGKLALCIADFDTRNQIASLTKTDIDAAFKRLYNFFEACVTKNLYTDFEITSPEYSLARQISDRYLSLHQLNFVLLSERLLSDRIQDIPNSTICNISVTYQIWDISRLHRLRSSKQQKEPLYFDFEKIFGKGIACLPAHSGNKTYQSYLIVMPANELAFLYEKYGARLLEQNVRTFLQARGNVNKGIRDTIINEPEMFFAYNNGITSTAESVETKMTSEGLLITKINDLQIVNGGQTTASLFHTKRKDKTDLSQIFVQMKLTVINSEDSVRIVPKISEYANTQNKVDAADFFSNHAFHIRIEEFSRRLWAPAQQGLQRESKWFYERARGQYADAQSTLTVAELKKFKVENPKSQMFTKTELAKFENVWEEHPKWVKLGAQKNFAQFAQRVSKEWEKSSDHFNEFFFKRLIARAIIYRSTEKIVSAQSWYTGGFRGECVIYTQAMLGEIAKSINKRIDFNLVWQNQRINPTLEKAISLVAQVVYEDITSPPPGVSNPSEWCKKDQCWIRLKSKKELCIKVLPREFFNQLVSLDDFKNAEGDAKKLQKLDEGIAAQKKVVGIPKSSWLELSKVLQDKGMLTQKEVDILRVALQIPNKIPSEKQSSMLLELLEKVESIA
jgi:hypothetical protein